MSDLEALLGGIVSEPQEETGWLVLADWLEENDDVQRAELLRLHRKLLATCCEPEAHPDRTVWQSRLVDQLAARVRPCVPQKQMAGKAWQPRLVTLIAAGGRPCAPQKTVHLTDGVPVAFSYIPPGSFLMGSNVNENEQPIQKATLTEGFFLGVYPVTQAQWKSVMGSEPSRFKGATRPVEQVSWDECQEFCKRLTADLEDGGRIDLPTEAEWEYAARA